MSRGASETLLAQFEQYLVLTRLSPLTVVNYLADLRDLIRWGIEKIGPEFALDTLSSETIRAYRSYLLDEKQCASSTVNRRLQALRKFCRFGVHTGILTSDPTEGVRLVQNDDGLSLTPLCATEVQTLLNVNSSDQPSLARRDTAVLMLLLYTGLRVNEMVGLQLDDVHFDHPGTHLTIADSRSGVTREVPLEGRVRHALSEYLAVRPNVPEEGHVFLSREGRPLSVRSLQRIVTTCARAAGLEGVSAQVLRRTYASRLLDNTGDLALVSRRLGHQSLATTSRFMAESSSQ